MKNPEYNLLDEPWIPVRLIDGTITDVGLLELLRRTTDIADLACELPTQSIAIQRLILAIAYRVATPRDARDWARQWDDGAPTEQMIEYLERWRDRFELPPVSWTLKLKSREWEAFRVCGSAVEA